MSVRSFLSAFLLLGVTHCGDAAKEDAIAGQETGGRGPSAGEEGGAAAPDGEGEGDTIPELNGCSPLAYEDHTAADAERVIQIAVSGLSYTPKCMIVNAGQSVRFDGSLAAHPLAPGNPDDPAAGSPENPIVEIASGRSVEFAFANPGIFPYYCKLHAFGAGKGMAGVIHVRP